MALWKRLNYDQVYQLKNEITHILAYSNAWKNDYISYISVFVNDDMLMYSASKPMPEAAVRDSAYQIYNTSKEFQDGLLKKGSLFLVDDGKIYHVRIMKHIYESQESLAIMIVMDEKSLRRQYSARNTMKSYLIDGNGVIFSSSEEEECGKECNESLLQDFA